MWIYINVFRKFHLNTLHFSLLLSLLIPFTNFLFRVRIHVHAFGMKIFTNAMRFHHCYINLEGARGSNEVLYNTGGTVNVWSSDWLIDWLTEYCFTSHPKIFHMETSLSPVKGFKLDLCFEQAGIFIVPLLLWLRASVFAVSTEGPPPPHESPPAWGTEESNHCKSFFVVFQT